MVDADIRRRLEEHLLPTFEDRQLAAISRDAVAAWERMERKAGYADGSLRSWRALLHLILADAVEDGLIAVNPAAKRRGRGKRVGRSQHRAAEKTITTALGVLLVAERAALLSGRDDEFIAVVTMGFSGIRWGELVGLETKYVRSSGIRVEWQLYELDNGQLHRCPPKDESRRTVAAPAWLLEMLAAQAAGRPPEPCPCHGQRYLFSGHRAVNGSAGQTGPRLIDVARRGGRGGNRIGRPERPADRGRVDP